MRKGRKRRWIASLNNFMNGNPQTLKIKVSIKAKKMIATISTTNTKDVPQRGCFVEYLEQFSAVNSLPSSQQKIDLCSAP